MTMSSLRLRLLIAAGAFILLATALAAVGLIALFERHVTRWADDELTAQMDQLIAGLDKGDNGQLAVVREPGDARFDRPLSGLYWEVLFEPTGPTFRSRSLWDFEIQLPPEVRVDDTLQHHYADGPGGTTLYLVQRRIELPARLDKKTALVAVALDAEQLRSAVWRFGTALVPFLLLIAGLLIAAAWAQVAVGLRPLSTVREKLAAVASGRERRLGSALPDEVLPLALEMDGLLAAREHEIEKARGRAADLAHGLKTPLQVLAADINRLKAKGETEIAAEIEKVSAAMRRHIDREMARARMAAADVNATADVASIAGNVARVVQRTPRGAGLAWSIVVPEGLVARIDPADLAEALGNLLENATRHASSAVEVAAQHEGNRVTIFVRDDGPGIPAALREDVLRRGRRLDVAAGDGAGLGLSIVCDIAESWGGGLQMQDDCVAEKRRFSVALTLPSAHQAA